MGNFSNYWDLHTLFTKIKNKLKSISDKIDDSVSLKTATGNPITLTDAAKANAEELSMTIELMQSGSGDPSPTNVRPISGLTEGKVVACGKNLLDLSSKSTATTLGITFTVNKNSDGAVTSINVNGTSEGTVDFTCPIPILKAGTQYILNGGVAGRTGDYKLQVIYGDNNADAATSMGEDVNFTVLPDVDYKMRIRVYSGKTVNNLTFYPMIRLATETDPTFEPYQGATATITFGQTVYGGSVNFKTGEVTVTHGMVDLGTLDWTFHPVTSSYNDYFDTVLPNDSILGDSEIAANIISPIYKTIPSKWIAYPEYDNNVQALAKNSRRFITCDSRYNNAADYTTAMTGIVLVYELATPTTLTLTPAELELLKGNNTITANGAEISIEYYPDNAIGALAGKVDDAKTQIDSKPSAADVDTRVRQSVYELGEVYSYNGNYYGRVFPIETGDADLTLFRANGALLPGIPEVWSPALAWRVKDVHAMIGVGYMSGRVFISGGNRANSTRAAKPYWTREILTDKSLATKYLHYISIQRYNESDNFPTYDVLIPIINNTAETMTKTEILAYLDEHGHIKPLHGMYIYRNNGNITSAEPVVDFVYAYYEGSEDKRLIFYRFEHEEHTLTTDAPYLRIEDRFVVQIMQNT